MNLVITCLYHFSYLLFATKNYFLKIFIMSNKEGFIEKINNLSGITSVERIIIPRISDKLIEGINRKIKRTLFFNIIKNKCCIYISKILD